jgi:RimJ/RimL family protein N-acetyltransferase
MPADACNSSAALSPAGWTTNVQLADGSTLCVRPLLPDDRERERDFIQSLSERSRYLRLFTPLRFLSPHLLDQLMDIDYDRRMALVATVQNSGKEEFVGVARYAEADQPDTAELGITVTDRYQRRGIARVLMRELARYARTRGFRRLIGLVLPENRPMISLAESLGYTSRYHSNDHLIHISLEL